MLQPRKMHSHWTSTQRTERCDGNSQTVCEWGEGCRFAPLSADRRWHCKTSPQAHGHEASDDRPSWRRAWEHVIPFFALPPDVRRVIYTTNVIESLHMQLRKIIKNRGHFPSDEAATKLLTHGGLLAHPAREGIQPNGV